ncbi:MAG: oligopeptide ABC transporter substrate-binding protein, partial [Enterococcus faecalis]
MNKKRILGAITLASVLVFGLAACGGGNKGGGNKATETEDISKMPIAVKNDKKAIDGGTLDVAVVMDTQFQGLFQREFSQDAYDSTYMDPAAQSLFNNDADFK